MSPPENKIFHDTTVSEVRTQPKDDWYKTVAWQAKHSSVILQGKITKVVSEQGRTANGDSYVESTISIGVSETFKGENRRIDQFRCLGGVIDRLIYSYSSLPIFFEGEEVIVFLEIIDGVLVIPVGWDAPKLVVLPDKTLSPLGLNLSEFSVWVRNIEEGM